GFAQRFDTVFISFVLPDVAVAWYSVPYNLIVMMLLMAQSLAISIYPENSIFKLIPWVCIRVPWIR
ncbi:MAG: hypothetical protein P8078_06450, partial [bacterium]